MVYKRHLIRLVSQRFVRNASLCAYMGGRCISLTMLHEGQTEFKILT